MKAKLHSKARYLVIAVIILIVPSARAMAQDSEILGAVEAKDIAQVGELLKTDPNLVNARTSGGSTPLHLAVGKKQLELIKLLLANGANVNATTRNGFTPLHVAAFVNDANAARVLISNGADIRAKAINGSTPLQLAIKKNATAVVRVLTTETSVSYTDKSIDARFAEGEKARTSGELEKAYAILSKLVKDQPDSEKINFAYGVVCMSMNECARAQLAFERIVENINPDNDRARLELANAYLAAKQYEAAKREFSTVLVHNTTEPQVRQNIEDGLDLIKRARKTCSLNGRIDAGYIDDSNVNIGPDSKTIGIDPIFSSLGITTLTVGEGSLPLEAQGYFASVTLFGTCDTGENGGWMTTMDGAYYQNWFNRNLSSNESAFYQAVVEMRDADESAMVRLPLRVAHVIRGQESLLDMYGFTPSYQCVFGQKADNILLSTDGTIEFRDWNQINDRDGMYFMLSERVQHLFGTQRHSAGGTASIFYEHTKAGEYENTGGSLGVDGALRLPSSMTLYGRARYTHTEYAEKEVLAPEKRKDDQFDLAGGLNWMATAQWGVDANFAWTDNISTFDLYQYKRNVTTISSFLVF
jgi:tetratricopeptide (TPR) repeat protein